MFLFLIAFFNLLFGVSFVCFPLLYFRAFLGLGLFDRALTLFLFLFVFSFIYFLLFESFLLLLRARLHWPVDSEKLMTGRLGRILYTHCRATGCSCWTRPAACSSGRSKEHFPVLVSRLSPLSLSLSLSVLSLRLHMVIESRHYSPICIAVSTECGGQSSITFEKFHPRLAANFLERSQIFI